MYNSLFFPLLFFFLLIYFYFLATFFFLQLFFFHAATGSDALSGGGALRTFGTFVCFFVPWDRNAAHMISTPLPSFLSPSLLDSSLSHSWSL